MYKIGTVQQAVKTPYTHTYIYIYNNNYYYIYIHIIYNMYAYIKFFLILWEISQMMPDLRTSYLALLSLLKVSLQFHKVSVSCCNMCKVSLKFHKVSVSR